jgi:pilus assembly protein FimV
MVKGCSVHKSKLKQISLAACLALMPFYGFAAGLGKLNVNSGLGEPLTAEIELLSLSPDELSSLSASVAPPEAYEVQGIPRLGIHNNIKVELAKSSDGSPILKLHSVQPVSEPYIDMLIQVDWSSGRLLREYTILLDPPEYKQSINDATDSVSPTINKPITATSPADYTPENQTATADLFDKQQSAIKSKKSKRQNTKIAEALTEITDKADGHVEQVTTQRGDSLLVIAKEVKPEGVSLDQMLLGLFEANKHAFVNDNMNRLKVGQILKVPTKETLTSISSQQANEEVKLHSANWNFYRDALAGNISEVDSADQNRMKQSASGKISSAEDLAEAKKAASQDVVKLSAGGKLSPQIGKASVGHDSKVLALQEEAIAKEKALKEIQDRTSALEAQIAEMQKLLSVKNQAMASAQKSAELNSIDAANTKLIDEKSQITQPTELKPLEVRPATSDASVKQSATVTANASSVGAAKPEHVDKKTASSKSKKYPAAVTTDKEQEPGFFEDIFAGIDLLILAAAGFILLLAAGWGFLRNKRKRDLDGFERGILTSDGLTANSLFGNTKSNASTSDTSFLTDFAKSADGGVIDTNEVDPIAEAEVYMAYGRDAQAEEILKDAIVKEPKRYELHLKLLEMYASRKDISAFEAIAGELYYTLGLSNPIWAKVVELGVLVDSDNPLYDVSRLPIEALPNKLMNANNNLDLESGMELDATGIELEQNQSTNEVVPFAADEAAAQSSNAVIADEGLQPGITKPAEVSQDNSLNFDFSELGNFSLDHAQDRSEDSIQAQIKENIESAPVLEMPPMAASDIMSEITLDSQNSQVDNAAHDFNFNVKEKLAFEPQTISFEPVDFGLDNSESAASEFDQQNSVMPLLSGIDINFHDEQKLDNQQFEEISYALPVVQDSIKLTEAAAEALPRTSNNFDFSSISLDLSDDASNSEALKNSDITVLSNLSADQALPAKDVDSKAASDLVLDTTNSFENDMANEPASVDIKLDLVKVYIDMEDVAGARDLLNEVIKEGGPKQRQNAELLLASLV